MEPNAVLLHDGCVRALCQNIRHLCVRCHVVCIGIPLRDKRIIEIIAVRVVCLCRPGDRQLLLRAVLRRYRNGLRHLRRQFTLFLTKREGYLPNLLSRLYKARDFLFVRRGIHCKYHRLQHAHRQNRRQHPGAEPFYLFHLFFSFSIAFHLVWHSVK